METRKSQIINRILLEEAGLLNDSNSKKLDHGARLHKQYNNTEFKILRASDKEIEVRVTQGKNAAGAYHEKKRLVEIVHELFDELFPGVKIHPQAIPYDIPAFEVVNPDYLERKMSKLKVGQKDIIRDTGMDRANVVNYLNGNKPMSSIVKALLYYYLEYRDCMHGV